MVVLVKISESSLSSVMVLSLKGAYGRSSCGCCNASVRSNAACVAVSNDDKIGILNCFGENLIASHTHVFAVFVM